MLDSILQNFNALCWTASYKIKNSQQDGIGHCPAENYKFVRSICVDNTLSISLLQHSLVCSLEAGLVGRSSQMCVSSLTLCSLELQATMTRLLPRVLFRLSQVAATRAMALPVLEFLSSLIPIPSLYSAFVEREYLSIVAIALPYTNHEK